VAFARKTNAFIFWIWKAERAAFPTMHPMDAGVTSHFDLSRLGVVASCGFLAVVDRPTMAAIFAKMTAAPASVFA
jgi:hypothetical protein